MKAISFHDFLHGFVEKRGTGTATLEAKLAHQLAARDQEPLYEVFLDLRKAYDALDRERTLMALKGYGVGDRILRLLSVYNWEGLVTSAARAAITEPRSVLNAESHRGTHCPP